MIKLDLKVRDLKTGSTGLATFETVEEALTWLASRPRFVDVLGVASHHVPPEVNTQLRAALRPLDDEERALEQRIEQEQEAQAKTLAAERQAAERAAVAEHRRSVAYADPNRPLQLRYRFNAGLSLADPSDTRAISDEARLAAMAWVEERNEWVRGRDQCVGEASLEVWPGAIPAGSRSERVVSGTFVPVTAPRAKTPPS
jgi:hypothetical protein